MPNNPHGTYEWSESEKEMAERLRPYLQPLQPLESHSMRVASEPEDYGDRGAGDFHIRSTRRAWIAECSCGWHAGSGIGWAWFRTKRDAVAAWKVHARGDEVGGAEAQHHRLIAGPADTWATAREPEQPPTPAVKADAQMRSPKWCDRCHHWVPTVEAVLDEELCPSCIEEVDNLT